MMRTATTAESDAPVIKLVSLLLLDAYTNRASDIHIEPLGNEAAFFVSASMAVWQEMPSPPKRLHGAIVSRLKIMSRSMSIAEKRLPQDGRIQVRVGDQIRRPPCFHHSDRALAKAS
jgi:type II secretory ATPase GspE/PulE/Tfp pilus assembly ATPase PilB-like protein